MAFSDHFKQRQEVKYNKDAEMASSTSGIIASTELREKRLNICNDCEHLLKITKNCKKCGCFVSLKTGLQGAKCPIGKW
jgi:hypothetical protein